MKFPLLYICFSKSTAYNTFQFKKMFWIWCKVLDTILLWQDVGPCCEQTHATFEVGLSLDHRQGVYSGWPDVVVSSQLRLCHTCIIDVMMEFRLFCINSLGPSDAIWRQRPGSPLAQVMAWCLTASSHYLNQCWLIMNLMLWHPPENNFIGISQNINSINEFENHNFKIIPGVNELSHQYSFTNRTAKIPGHHGRTMPAHLTQSIPWLLMPWWNMYVCEILWEIFK